jgi:hypothetical protein
MKTFFSLLRYAIAGCMVLLFFIGVLTIAPQEKSEKEPDIGEANVKAQSGILPVGGETNPWCK